MACCSWSLPVRALLLSFSVLAASFAKSSGGLAEEDVTSLLQTHWQSGLQKTSQEARMLAQQSESIDGLLQDGIAGTKAGADVGAILQEQVQTAIRQRDKALEQAEESVVLVRVVRDELLRTKDINRQRDAVLEEAKRSIQALRMAQEELQLALLQATTTVGPGVMSSPSSASPMKGMHWYITFDDAVPGAVGVIIWLFFFIALCAFIGMLAYEILSEFRRASAVGIHSDSEHAPITHEAPSVKRIACIILAAFICFVGLYFGFLQAIGELPRLVRALEAKIGLWTIEGILIGGSLAIVVLHIHHAGVEFMNRFRRLEDLFRGKRGSDLTPERVNTHLPFAVACVHLAMVGAIGLLLGLLKLLGALDRFIDTITEYATLAVLALSLLACVVGIIAAKTYLLYEFFFTKFHHIEQEIVHFAEVVVKDVEKDVHEVEKKCGALC